MRVRRLSVDLLSGGSLLNVDVIGVCVTCDHNYWHRNFFDNELVVGNDVFNILIYT